MSLKKKIGIGSMLLIIVVLLAIPTYFFVADIESVPTKEIAKVCRIEQRRYRGRKVFIISAKEKQKSDTIILYLHGGSYVAEMSSTHWEFIRDIAIDTNATIILPDYPLTPKYQYTHVFAMLEPLYKQIQSYLGEKKLLLIGDSAGGGMSLALCQKIAQKQQTQPKKLILLSPWLDVTLQNAEIEKVQVNDKNLNKETLKIAGIAYAGGEEKTKDYLVSPLYGNMENLPNISIYTGTYDILNPDVKVLKEKAPNANIEIKEYKEAQHIWLLERGNKKTQASQAAYEDLVQEILAQ